ncbi:hypothetical protein GUJ93_ZPchr0008g12642 [Zizania palustris]|uniref:Uncharacterized protein n=1 Tax=Zizania palustris TaxID=103762 RepID=A0A8J5RJ97_ZIZPA|nr:hypothetical protein GUJ93_ZPchr0008g12642 [Zizania palustris]
MAKGSSRVSYEPAPAFEECSEEAMLDISPTESTELWLIQWPLNQLDASDFHGEELTLKLHHDGKLGSLEGSSGKSYDVVSFSAQQPDATVFLPSGSEAKADPEELEKPGFGSLTPSSKKSAGEYILSQFFFTDATFLLSKLRENYSHAIIIFRNCLHATVSDCGGPHLAVTQR